MKEEATHVIHTGTLFNALNRIRRKKDLEKVDNPVIASRIGILFALKTSTYVNFKGEYITLNETQLSILQGILEEHFNVDMATEIRTFVAPPQRSTTEEVVAHMTAPTPKKGLFSKIKGFLKNKAKAQESHA